MKIHLAFSEDACVEQERVRLKVIPKRVVVGLKRIVELNRRRLSWKLA